ncbi:CHRD domain-containing protein [Rhizocola hellebori]|uniref:CHRD domain-containing protein n=1 Tax=Rhizocola hellebori TaxID=1392758 RepID=A0A8J3QDP4_9ACTN|nr:CHRD domain-containing protein [Rhizocola hellebori]GIH08865.1 CHRD domain-containing protein [Rhizocola hellebori]
MIVKRARVLAVVMVAGAAVLATTAGSAALAHNDSSTLNVRLSGYQEDPLVFSTTGRGTFRVNIDERAQEVTYRLSYTGLEGNVAQAHIHLGGRAQSGGIMVFLCTNNGNGPAGTQLCPAAPATVTGTITPADIIGPTGQGITAGQFDEFVAAIRAGTSYVNVHSSLYPGGEIRAQLDHEH